MIFAAVAAAMPFVLFGKDEVAAWVVVVAEGGGLGLNSAIGSTDEPYSIV